MLLCTLLLGNVAVNALLSIFLADLTSGLVGFFASTIMIVIFGEITPQSICSRHGLMIGAYTVIIVRIFIVLLYIIAKPIAMVLDCILGEELGNILSKDQLKKLFEMYEKDQWLNPDERKLMTAALEIQDKKAKSIMTHIEKIYMLDINTKLSEEKIHEIYLQGYSRIPIFDGKRDNIVGILLVRDLLVFNNRRQIVTLKQLGSLIIRDIIAVDSESKLGPILKEFKKGTSHLCIVRKTVSDGDKDPYLKNMGIISLEDIIEEILQDDIEDENDHEMDKVLKGEGVAKQKLLNLFSEKRCSKVLTEHERNAVCSYLTKFEEPFKRSRISQVALEALVSKSDIVNVQTTDKALLDEVEEEEEVKEKNGVIFINGDDKKDESTNDIHIIKGSDVRRKRGQNVDSSAVKADDINLKLNPKFKSKTQVPEKDVSIPNGSENSSGQEQSESEQSESRDINYTNMQINGDKYIDSDDMEEGPSYEYEINEDKINPILIVRNAP